MCSVNVNMRGLCVQIRTVVGHRYIAKQKENTHNDLAAARLCVFNGTTLVDLHLAGRFGGARRRSHTVLDLSGHRHKGLLYVGCVLRRRLEEWNPKLVGVFLI